MSSNADAPPSFGDRRAFAIVLVLHFLLLQAIRYWPAKEPKPQPAAQRGEMVVIQLQKPKPPKPPAKTIPKPTTSGVKLAARPSVGVPTAKTIEHHLATVPEIEVDPMATQVAVVDALPNLAAISVASSTVGTGGTGKAGAGAGAKGTGAGGTGKLFEDCADTPDRPMVADVYRLQIGAGSVHDMDQRKPVKRVCLAQLNIPTRSFREGFPGMRSFIEWFGLDIRFTVNIAEAGTFDFVLISDDGAVLSIDDVEVINNDGQHAAKPEFARVRLAAGLRRFRVRYYQGPREYIALQLAWRKQGESYYDFVPQELLGRPGVVNASPAAPPNPE